MSLNRLSSHPLLSPLMGSLYSLPAPSNLNYMWNIGSLLGINLVLQIVTGVLLAIHYVPHVDLAFDSVEHIMRDVNYGWVMRYFHANGASSFFILVYLHIARGLYFQSFLPPRILVWSVGVFIFILMMATAFIGYVLPWGQISFWGATVITNLLSAIPYLGSDIVEWVWGGFSVGNPTLNRFFSLHYLLPFILVGLVIMHLMSLHVPGSNSPIGNGESVDRLPFHPYYTFKDLVGLCILALFLGFLVFFFPNYLGHPDNYIPANPLSTPPHIVPEWYFLFAYAILRSIPNKLLGVIAMFSSLLILLLCPFLNCSLARSPSLLFFPRLLFWFFVFIFLGLTWLGGQPVEVPYVSLGGFLTLLYFSFFLFLLPFVQLIESHLYMRRLYP